MAEKVDVVRIYKIDKPDFLSCGRSYITDNKNLIIMYDLNSGRGLMKLVARTNKDMPHTLAPSPVEDHNWGVAIKRGVRVYPSCNADTPGGYLEEGEVPTILDMVVLSQEDFKNYLLVYGAQLKEWSSCVTKDFKKVDVLYQQQKKAIENKIRTAKEEIRKRYVAPDLCNLVFKK